MPERQFYKIWEGAILSPHTLRPHSDILLAQGYMRQPDGDGPEL
jgi:hypothetical protein